MASTIIARKADISTFGRLLFVQGVAAYKTGPRGVPYRMLAVQESEAIDQQFTMKEVSKDHLNRPMSAWVM